MPNDVSPDDPLSRFLLNSNRYSRQKNRVKSVAFMPAPDLNLSVYQTKDLSDDKIWKIGNRVKGDDKKLHGRGDILVRSVCQRGLKIIPDNTPPLHANISGWPKDKMEQKQIADKLAADATLHLYQE